MMNRMMTATIPTQAKANIKYKGFTVKLGSFQLHIKLDNWALLDWSLFIRWIQIFLVKFFNLESIMTATVASNCKDFMTMKIAAVLVG
mgnify:CR=1 FL=1